MAGRRQAPGARIAALVEAARALFFERGVDQTSVEDITRAAGVAHGTFYLYFKTKDDAVNAVIAEMAGEMVERVSDTARAPELTASDKLLAVREALVGLSALASPVTGDLLSHYHGPEHREVHDRLSHEVNRQLVPVIAAIIEQGVAEGTFDVADPIAAAAFTLSAAEGLDLLDSDADAQTRVRALMTFVLRGLGACESD
jgi:AcrR family transcriptional regulator